MRILVTGASGFVGGHLMDALADDHEVIAVVRRDVDLPRAAELRNVPAIDSKTDWAGVLGDVDVVIHLAARVHVMHETANDPLDAFREINVRGVRRLAESCVEQGVRRIVFLSSIKVNGEATHGSPFTVSSGSAPVDPYGVSKMEAEEELLRISRGSELEVVVLRPPVIYGPGVKGNIHRLMRLIDTRIPIPLGSIQNSRSMLSIQNLVYWFKEAITASDIPLSPVLIADPEPISTPELIRSLSMGMGHRVLVPPFPVSLLTLGGALFGQGPALQRLVEDLVVQPTTEAFPGVASQLKAATLELTSLGEQHRRSKGGTDK